MSPRTLLFAAVLPLLTSAGCKSPEDVGFEAGAKYISIYAAVGADTTTMSCPERLALAQEFKVKGKADRMDLKSKVEGTRDDESFDRGMQKMTGDIRTKVYEAFARDCPEQAPAFAEMMEETERELGIAGKLPPLVADAPAAAPADAGAAAPADADAPAPADAP